MAKIKEMYEFKYKGEVKLLKYDRVTATVIYVSEATVEEIVDNEEWLRMGHSSPLWDIDSDGYIEVLRTGLGRMNWDDKELRDEYLECWFWEMAETLSYELAHMIW